ncbi:MAG TPA: sugar phosphate nucleotidyltransferase [Patescibacteria group bacterium]|nr:sugar phosphate nucleotidyltransferase [Patescibacteria group bacterium]
MKSVAVIMAGGAGARLWPRSTEKRPKQFIHLIGEGTMIQNTVMRLFPLFAPEDIYIVTLSSLVDVLRSQLPVLPSENIIGEPFGRNTAPCIALASIYIEEKYKEDVVIVALPSDHLIYNVREFHHSLEVAQKVASELDGIVTIGVAPTRPETAFGYIQVREGNGTLVKMYNREVLYAVNFAEKPDIDTAQRFADAGDFYWNSGMFIARISTLWSSFDAYLPDHAPLFHLIKKYFHKPTYPKMLDSMYKQMRPLSFDYGIMEKATNVFVVLSSFGWSDVGSWDELYRLSMKDAKNNAIEGDVIAMDSTNCFVSSNGKMIGLIGVEDLIVVDSDNGLVICKRGDSQKIRDLVDFMRRKQITGYL